MRLAAVSPWKTRGKLRFAFVTFALLVLTALPASAGSLQVTITSPGDGQNVSGNVSWAVSVSSNNVDHVDFAVDGKVVSTSQRSPFGGAFDSTSLSNGAHQLTATAYAKGGSGGSANASETVTVANGSGPSIQSPPSISGGAVVGQVLDASIGTWSGATPMTYVYSWNRCDSSGARCAAIAGATDAHYSLVTADAGSTLRVSITATNGAASAIATSAATGVVTTPSTSTTTQAPKNASLPSISGMAALGQVLSASTGGWGGTTPMSYGFAWSRCDSNGASCSTIAGAVSPTYAAVAADAGATLRVTVTASNSAGSASATSAATAVVAAAPSGGSSSPSLGTKLPTRMPESSGAKTLIVSPAGSGSSCTLSVPCGFAQAWALAASGTIINLRGGSYTGYQVVQGRRYSAANPVTLQSYPGETATFTGCSSSCPQSILYFGNDLGIRIRNITLTGTANTGSAVKLDDDSYVELDHLTIHNVYQNGVLIVGDTVSGFAQAYNDHIQIWNSIFYNAGMMNGPNTTNQAENIYVGSGAYTDGVKHGVDGFVIANNLFYNQPNGYEMQVGNEAANGFIVNNTFDHAYGSVGDGGSGMVIWGAGSYPTNHVVVANNIFTNHVNHGVQSNCGSALVGIDVHSNLAYSNVVSPDYLGGYGRVACFAPGQNLTATNPLYVNRSGGDYHLQPGSPARNVGDPAYTPPFDADGNPRSGPHLGALN